MKLQDRMPPIQSPLEARLMAEYGAIFVTSAVPPPKIIFADESDVSSFQASLDTLTHLFGEHEIRLQAQAMAALKSAVAQAAGIRIGISPRSADSGGRSYEDTLALWRRNVGRGLDYWVSRGALSAEQAQAIRNMPTLGQIEAVLDLEETRQIFFSTYYDKSILQSVAAPGASQHLSLLAFDVAEYSENSVETVMAQNGWYRTVLSDLPHF